MQVGAPIDTNSIVAALKNAAAATGSDFHYLLGTAMRESSLKANAQSSTSSAAGLFQFIDQTWMGLVKTHGAKYGLGSLAGAINTSPDGRYHAASDADRQTILALKKDPQISALMAGEYARSTQGAMEANLGRQVCGGELYAAHFLGADAACKLIRTSQNSPSASAAQIFPQAAGANRNVFFHADGTAKSVREVYDWAMQQPGSTAPLAGAPVAAAANDVTANPAAARRIAAHAVDANIETLLAGVMNWQPKGFFGSQSSSSLSFGSGLLDLFSSMRNES
ncbi:MAG: lytic transglycosylase domain-containing protein [Alphaproteobacteria bacterium]|nr:lytic transglycosylase domain-containing protein [Alphaproteobacteria bacterium]